jgi:hypothetical protein
MLGLRTLAFTRLLLRGIFGNTLKNHELLVVSGWSSGRLGAVSGELDGQERGRGSPAAAGGMGRARERAKLHEMR